MRVQPAGRMRRMFREAVLFTVGLPIFGTAAWAGPENATVVHGTATFQQSGSYTAIQASDKAIINYRSFDVARPETVQFIQPGTGASVLNRIVSANPTTIDGTILANGRVFFVNPAGVIFGESAQVNVAQLVASALEITNTDFLNGRYDFKGGDGSVINKGQISAERAYLIGKQVANLGSINCPNGYVVMAAGDRVFLGEPGTDLVVEMDEPAGSGQAVPAVGAAVRNEGTVEAAGGSIMLAAAGDIYAHAISNVGRLSASAASGNAGAVKLAAPEGTVINTGSIEASSESGTGGQVQVLGDRVGLFGSGRIDASGAAGGGTVLVGGDYRGRVEVPSASRTSVGPDASLHADATRDGDGGKVIVWSDEVTKFNGHASAMGAGRGAGGLIEVSGKQDLSFAGTVALGSPSGRSGTLLLDPGSITITDGGENLSPQDDLAFGDAPYQATISELTLENTATGSNAEIVLEATNDIVVNDLTDNALTLSPGVSLVLRTRNNPAFQENSSGGLTMNTGDSIVASGGGNLTLQAGHDGAGFVAGSAAHVSTGSLITDGGSVTVQATGDVSVQSVTTGGAANAAGGSVLLEAGVGTASYYLDVSGAIDTSGGPDADASGANPAGSVTLSGGVVYPPSNIIAVGGNDNGGDGPGGAGGTVSVGAPLAIYVSNGNIRTSGGSGSVVGNGGSVTFNGPTSLGGDLTITAGSGNVAFLQPVDGIYGDLGLLPSNLVVNSAGTTRFESPVGGYYPITSITTDASGTTEINADITTGTVEVSPPATQIYNDPVLLTNNVTLTDLGATGIFLNGTVDGAAGANYALTVTTDAGDVVFGGAVGSGALGALSNAAGLGAITVTSGGSTQINGGAVRSIASQVYYSPVTLNSPAVLTGTYLTFLSTIAAGASDLTLTGDGITLGGAVSGTGALTLQPVTPTRDIYVGIIGEVGLNLDSSELGYLQNGFSRINIGRLDGQHNLYIYQTTFQDPMTFRSPVPGGGIYVMGKITGIDNASLTLLGAGATTVLYDGIEMPGQDIVISDSVRLGDNLDITLSTGAGGGNIAITGPVNGTVDVQDMGDETLTLAAGTGTITVGDIFGAAGAASASGLTAVSVTSSGAATFGGIDITGALTQTNAATGATTFTGPVRVGSASLQGTSLDFAGTVTTAGNMDVTAAGPVAFGGAVTLGGALTTNATGSVAFQGTIDDDGNPQTSSNVAVNSAGATRFGGPVGAVQPIDSLATDAAGTTEVGANVTTRGSQAYRDPLVLTNNVILTDQGTGGILFQNTVNGNGAGPWDLTTITTGTDAGISFAAGVGGTQAVDQITVTNAGTLYLFGNMNLDGAFLQNGAGSVYTTGSITTSGDAITFEQGVTTGDAVTLNTGAGGGPVTFQDALVLDGDMTVTTGTGDVTFGGAIDRAALWSAADLVVNSAGTTRFESPVGQQRSIYSITTDAAGTTEIGADITTGTAPLAPAPATQTYNDPVVLTNNVTLTDRGTTGIFFNNTVNGNGASPWDLRVETTDPGPTAQVLFNGAVTLGSGLWVQTAGPGNVTFQSMVDGGGTETNSDLTVNSAGTTRFNAAVGGIQPVGRVHTDAAGTTEINANIVTGGHEWYATQIYYDPVVLTNSVTLTDTGADGISFNNTVNGDGQGPWDLTVVTTDPAARIQFNGAVSLDGGLTATAAGDIQAGALSSASHNISLHSTAGNLNLQGTVNADRDAGSDGGGVSLVADAGMIQTGDGLLGVTVIGYSDGQRGVDLPYGTGGKTAILIDSDRSLQLAAFDSLIARGRYAGSRELLVPETEESPRWARDLTGGTYFYSAGLTDDRAAVGFSAEPYYGGMPLDVAIYARSRSANVMLNTPVTVPDGATVVLDASDTIGFGSAFTTSSSFPNTSRLEIVSRATTSLATPTDRSRFPYSIAYSGRAVEENQSPAWFTGYASVLRGGTAAAYLATREYWYWHAPAPVPPPLPVIVVPVVVPPIPTYPIERLSWIPLAEIVVGPIQPPHPDCLDVKDEDIEVLRKCQVACDLFSTDVALNIVAEDIVTLNQRLKAQVQQVLPGLDNLSQKWPRVRPSDMPAIEQALRQDQALNSWLQDGVEFVKLLRTKLGRTTNDSVERFLLEYLANATDEPVLDFVQAYLKSQLASAAETGKPVAWTGR